MNANFDQLHYIPTANDKLVLICKMERQSCSWHSVMCAETWLTSVQTRCSVLCQQAGRCVTLLPADFTMSTTIIALHSSPTHVFQQTSKLSSIDC